VRRYLIVATLGSAFLAAAGFAYASQKSIPLWATIPIIAAFVVEFMFYLIPGFAGLRSRLEAGLSRQSLALCLTIAAVLPYLIYSLGTGQFRWTAFARLAVVVAFISFWYVIRPATPTADALIWILIAAVMLTKFFLQIYTSPIPSVRIDVLGHLLLVRLGAMVMLVLRRAHGIGFGFLPTRHEWLIGLQYFALFLPIGFPLAFAIGLVRLQPSQALWQDLLIFIGALWVLALSEEFFFRGLLQQWISDWMHNARAGWMVASVVFGACHLSFRTFPNWKFAALATVAGLFYGRAYQKASGIRAPMVAHALVVTVLQAFRA
jgi:membrane protease YdiL (CAAX protease family)